MSAKESNPAKREEKHHASGLRSMLRGTLHAVPVTRNALHSNAMIVVSHTYQQISMNRSMKVIQLAASDNVKNSERETRLAQTLRRL